MRRKHVRWYLIVLVLVLANTSMTVQAQSTDQANPTPITSSELVINGPKKTNQQYFYSFTGGPGEVTIAVSTKAKSSSTFVGIKVFDAELSTLTYHNMSADTGPSMALKKFDVGEKQTLVLSFNSDPSLGECRLKFGGAVEFAASTSNGNLPAPVSESKTTMSKSQTDVMTSASDQGSQPAQSNSESKNKTLVFSILDAVGQRLNIPATGKLRLEMKDGTVQEIDLTQVKKILVKN